MAENYRGGGRRRSVFASSRGPSEGLEGTCCTPPSDLYAPAAVPLSLPVSTELEWQVRSASFSQIPGGINMTPLQANDVKIFLLSRFSATMSANGLSSFDIGDDF